MNRRKKLILPPVIILRRCRQDSCQLQAHGAFSPRMKNCIEA